MAETNNTAQEPSWKGWTPEERAQIAANTMDDEVFGERMIQQLKASPAFFSKEGMYALEDKIQKDQMRRFAFAFASMTGAEFLEAIENDYGFAVAACAHYEDIKTMAERYRGLADIFENISKRILIAVASREDMEQIMEECK